ncbi:hypothetical protein Thiowin_00913 [Thiorhodovibrio winogradskyi]|uniref:Uncharacterized protein n=1 Tax=Thiorhodovibrio winogradskyi TaxID=77007 RepID=A0ABZ0S4N1_9GAMM
MTALEIMDAACVSAEGRSFQAGCSSGDLAIGAVFHHRGAVYAKSDSTSEALPPQSDLAHFLFHSSLSQEQREDIPERFHERAAITEFDGGCRDPKPNETPGG